MSTVNSTKETWKSCGSNFCPSIDKQKTNPNFERPSDENVYTVAGIYLACMIFASLLVAFGLVSVKR